jgi:hypothetical protein
MNIKETFLKLTDKTYPYGYENILVNSMIKQGVFPEDLCMDINGNFYFNIGESRTIFASHFDTVSTKHTDVVHTFDNNMIGTDGKTTLGADDKAGVTIMLYMMKHNIPGLYYFFIGEEVGCIGSGLAAKMSSLKNKYDRIISFDRRGLKSVITHQSSRRTCSDTFADALSLELNKSGLEYEKDNTGSFTDSNEFTSIIPECTNISVGYYKAHTFSEQQDIEFLEKLSKACLLVDWENLPTERDMSVDEYKSYSTSYSSTSINNGYNDYYGCDDYYDDTKNFKPTRRGRNKNKSRNRGGRTFIDYGGELVPFKHAENVDIRHDRNYYDSLVDKILDEKLSINDLSIIKEQYLDMNNKKDEEFYYYLLSSVVE